MCQVKSGQDHALDTYTSPGSASRTSESHAGDSFGVVAAAVAGASCASLRAPPAAAHSACTVAAALMLTFRPGEQKCITTGLTGLFFTS